MKKISAFVVTALFCAGCSSANGISLQADYGSNQGKAVTILRSAPQIPAAHLAKETLSKGIRTAAETSVVYVVKHNDTLSGIASHNDLNWKGLYCFNKKAIGNNPSIIYPKDRLLLSSSHCKIPAQHARIINRKIYQSAPQYPSQSPPVNYSGYGSFQQCVIQRESGGDPSAVNPTSGAGGLYGFLPSTWSALGFPGLPENATVEMQNEAFAKAYALDGTAPWAAFDGC